MLIVCPTCATPYDVQLASLSPNGRQVRCARCRTVWYAEPSRADKLLAAAAAIAPDAGGAEQAADPFGAAAAALAAGPAAETAGEASSFETAGDGRPADEGLAALTDEHDTDVTAPVDEGSVDADGQSIDVEAPSIVPVDRDDSRPPIEVAADEVTDHHAGVAEDIESYAARRRRSAKRQSMRWPLSLLQTGILALAFVDAILVGWRHDVVRVLPQTASFYALMGLPVNLRGLTFDDVVTSTEQHEGVPILVIEGNIVNDTRKAEDVPRLKFVVRNAAHQEIYSWTAVPSRTMLPAGAGMSFRTRLASPPPDARDIVLRFVNRRDIIAGAH